MSPKITILFEMEKQMMGDNSESLNFEEFFQSISGILIAIIKEVSDILIEEFKKLVFKKIKDIYLACLDDILKSLLFKASLYLLLSSSVISSNFGTGTGFPSSSTAIIVK